MRFLNRHLYLCLIAKLMWPYTHSYFHTIYQQLQAICENFSLQKAPCILSTNSYCWTYSSSSSLPNDDLNNFRPISNLNFISKILEKVVASRTQSHLLSNSLSSSFQSAYRMFHSTETTLLNIHNDLIFAMNRGEVTSLILLDLSAAFDTVDHSILLHRLQNWFGLHGTSLDWFSSYLTSRSQAVSIQNSTSSLSNLSCGVPQGSVLGPLFSHSIQPLLVLSSPRTQPNTTSMLMTPSYTSLSHLQIQLLHLKYFPTLFLTYSPGWTQTKYSSIHLKLNFYSLAQNNNDWNFLKSHPYFLALKSSLSALLLVILASSLTLTCHSQIKLTPCLNPVIFISEAFAAFVISFLFLHAAIALANSLVSSKLYYCNSLYNGISQANLNKIQRIQNTLARFVTNTSKFEHITPILKKLHWLPIKQRIDYKLCFLTYKTLQIQQPTYNRGREGIITGSGR